MTTTTPKGIDPGRLRRAIALKAERIGTGGWLVNGRLVDPDDGCHCPDRQIRGATCKHELAARLDVLDPELRDALAVLGEEAGKAPEGHPGAETSKVAPEVAP